MDNGESQFLTLENVKMALENVKMASEVIRNEQIDETHDLHFFKIWLLDFPIFKFFDQLLDTTDLTNLKWPNQQKIPDFNHFFKLLFLLLPADKFNWVQIIPRVKWVTW